jgi:hypothetical protein
MMPRYHRRRPWEKRGEIGTGAPPESPTKGWRIDYSKTVGSGTTYHYLNVYVVQRSQDVRVVVKQNVDGSYWCNMSRCASRKRRTLQPGDDSYAGCIHEQFVRDQIRGAIVPPTDAPSTHADRDAPADAYSEPGVAELSLDDEPEPCDLEDADINPPPF